MRNHLPLLEMLPDRKNMDASLLITFFQSGIFYSSRMIAPADYFQFWIKNLSFPVLIPSVAVAFHQEGDVAIELSNHYKAILFNQRGTGKAWTKPLDSPTINLETATEDLTTFRRHLHTDKFNLYGRS